MAIVSKPAPPSTLTMVEAPEGSPPPRRRPSTLSARCRARCCSRPAHRPPAPPSGVLSGPAVEWSLPSPPSSVSVAVVPAKRIAADAPFRRSAAPAPKRTSSPAPRSACRARPRRAVDRRRRGPRSSCPTERRSSAPSRPIWLRPPAAASQPTTPPGSRPDRGSVTGVRSLDRPGTEVPPKPAFQV